MKVKRFTAPTMAEALKQVKGTLGPDAVILETTEAAGQVTVTAAAAPASSVRLFFGPPGDGKTTTIAKLAAQARRAGRRVCLVGADTYRIGAAAELERYGQALGAEVRRAKDPVELGNALRDHGHADLVLVDTAGAGPAQQAELAELKALVAAAGAAARLTPEGDSLHVRDCHRPVLESCPRPARDRHRERQGRRRQDQPDGQSRRRARRPRPPRLRARRQPRARQPRRAVRALARAEPARR